VSALEVVTFGEIIGNLLACDVGPLHRAERFERRLAGSELNTAIQVASMPSSRRRSPAARPKRSTPTRPT
jgi:hypothetical protein